jgi:hypothetical protein
VILANCTPHDVHLRTDTGKIVTLSRPNRPARCEETRTLVDHFVTDRGLVPLNQTGYGAVVDLPAPVSGTFLIVSKITYDACPARNDLVCVDELLRDSEGRIIAARSLCRPIRG